MQRPDLSNVDPAVVAYIEYLERKAGVRPGEGRPLASRAAVREEEPAVPERAEPLPAERETTASIITITREGYAKRTYRHLFHRQHRGGMGVFGIDLMGDDEPAILSCAEENQNLLFFTSRARVFRQPLSVIVDGPLNARGSSLAGRFNLEQDETLVAVLPEQARGYVALVTASGRVRSLRHHLFGEHMRPGTAMFNYNEVGPLASVCWTSGDGELFILTQEGIGIRFAEKAISPQGDQGIRLSGSDRVVAITPVSEDSGVFMVSSDGRGTIRQMSGFAANKSPGGSGKTAIKSNRVVGAVTIERNDDIFLFSRLGKVVRFPADEVPTTEGVVQGVNCMGLRGDEVVAVLKSGPIY